MNRTVLIMVVLFTLIFASIMLNLLERSQMLTDQMDAKISRYNVGNLGAYALNWAIGQIQDGLVTDTETMVFDGVSADSFKVLGGQIDQIFFNYDYVNEEYVNPVKIVADVSWLDQSGERVNHTSEAILDIRTISPYQLVGHWQMNEDNWNGVDYDVLDSTDNANHAIAMNGANTVAADAEVPWDAIGSFDGYNDFVEVKNGVTGLYDDQMTFGSWVKVNHDYPIDVDFGVIATEFDMDENPDWQPPRWGQNGHRYRHGHGGESGTGYSYQYRHHYHPEKHPGKYFAPVWSLRVVSWQFLVIFQYVAYQFVVVTETGVDYIYVDHFDYRNDIFDWHYVTVSYDASGASPVIKLRVPSLDLEASKTLNEPWVGHDDDNKLTFGGRETYTHNVYGVALSCFDGNMYGAGLFSKALADDEVDELYQNYQNGISPVCAASQNMEIKIVYWND